MKPAACGKSLYTTAVLLSSYNYMQFAVYIDRSSFHIWLVDITHTFILIIDLYAAIRVKWYQAENLSNSISQDIQ